MKSVLSPRNPSLFLIVDGTVQKKRDRFRSPWKFERRSLSVANGLRSRETVQKRVPAVYRSGGLDASEPREEYEVFRVVGESVQRDGERGPSDWISHFKVALASAHLSDVTPCGDDIG